MKASLILLLNLIVLTSSHGQLQKEKYYFKTNIGTLYDKVEILDSANYFYETNGDTITWYTMGSSRPYQKKELKTIRKHKNFGTFIQEGVTLNDGRVNIHKLASSKYLIRNDSLFREKTEFLIPSDSLFLLMGQIRKADNVETKKKLRSILENSRKKCFELIFTINLERASDYESEYRSIVNNCIVNMKLTNKWTVNGMNYYKCIVSEICEDKSTPFHYLIDENLRFVTFGSHYRSDKMLLTDENSLLKN